MYVCVCVSVGAACDCNAEWSFGDVCDNVTGQCECVTGVGGRTCDRCHDSYFNSSRIQGSQAQPPRLLTWFVTLLRRLTTHHYLLFVLGQGLKTILSSIYHLILFSPRIFGFPRHFLPLITWLWCTSSITRLYCQLDSPLSSLKR